MKENHRHRFVITLLFFCIILAACFAQEESSPSWKEEDENVDVSPKCAAILLASGTTIGVASLGLGYALPPVALCSAGFCATGVASGSFAAWWQSTMPLVAKGSLFAMLQSIAMGGGGSVSAGLMTGGSLIGASVAASYLRDVCSYVDKAEPNSPLGRIFDASATAVTSSIAAKDKIVASDTYATVSAAGTVAVDSLSFVWNDIATRATQAASWAGLQWEITSLEVKLESGKKEHGVRLFDYMRNQNLLMATLDSHRHPEEVEKAFNDCLEKILTLEAQMKENLCSGPKVSTNSLEREIETHKRQFGVRVFDDHIIRENDSNSEGSKYSPVGALYQESLHELRSLQGLIQEKQAMLEAE